MKGLLFTLVFGISVSALAIPERDVLSDMVKVLDQQNKTFYTINYFETRTGLAANSTNKNLKIYYTKFGTKKGSRGSLVIVPGRTEPSLKFVEVATDFINRGYSPVYAIDHRGQGFSPTVTSKTLPDPDTIGHVESFDHYIKDLESFVSVVLKDPNVNKQKLFLVSNSMGGAIAMRYFQRNPRNPFKKAALSASMFKIITDESFPFLKTSFICQAGFVAAIFTKIKCYDYTPGEAPFRWTQTDRLPDGREIKARPFSANGNNSLTSSHSRYRLNDYIFNKWPQTIVGGPSLKWTEQALGATNVVRRFEELKRVKTPVFLLIAENDFRTEPEAQRTVCKRLGNLCEAKSYRAYHEILMENDSIRDFALRDIFSYFER